MPSKTPGSKHAIRIAKKAYEAERERHREKLRRRRAAEAAYDGATTGESASC